MALNNIQFGKSSRIARLLSTSDEYVVISKDLNKRTVLLREYVDGICSNYARVNGSFTVDECCVEITTVVFTSTIAERLFKQYCATHSGIYDGTHMIRKSKSGLCSVQKDPSFRAYASNIEPCENCGCSMHLKHNSKGQPFYGCSSFHRSGCRGSRRFEDPTKFSPGNIKL